MAEYRIFADAACDIPAETLREWGVNLIDMTFRFTDEETERYNGAVSAHDFYEQMRKGRCSRTAAINTETFLNAFRPTLRAGCDLLYIAFSSGLSITFEQSVLAVRQLREEFPDRTIETVDSLAASGGYGLIVYMAAKEKERGATLDETKAFVERTRLHVCHWFTVDDLVYLKRGGRVSSAVALVGTVLGIKPVLHVDDEGHLINVTKARSRRRSLRALADAFVQSAIDPKAGPVFISHGDCPADAELLERMVREAGGTVDRTTYIGPVIGSHSGPGTAALFFLGKQR